MTEYHEEPWEAAERDHAERIEREAAAWRARWPNHCKHCGGWGGFAYVQSHGPGLREPMVDLCDDPEDLRTCHRCGELGCDEDGNGPCTACGWDNDDGVPQY